MRDGSGSTTVKTNGGKRASRLISTVSSHMVNYPPSLQSTRPARRRQTLLGSCPACRARSAA